jgi:hypothetical protein
VYAGFLAVRWRLDDWRRSIDDQLVHIGTLVVSQDGKTLTNPETGIRATGLPPLGRLMAM